jgi:SNF2 family DNA or RNA helicase
MIHVNFLLNNVSGQTRSVFVNRLVIADTVEDRILALQERKKNLADGSLGEGTGKKLGSTYQVYLC